MKFANGNKQPWSEKVVESRTIKVVSNYDVVAICLNVTVCFFVAFAHNMPKFILMYATGDSAVKNSLHEFVPRFIYGQPC